MLHLGIVSTLTDKHIARLHGAQRVLTRDAEAPAAWGRAIVRRVVQPGAERLDGVAMMWAGTAAELAGWLALDLAPPDPVVLVVLAQQPLPTDPVHALLDALRQRGQCVKLLCVPAEGALWQLRIGDGQLLGLPADGELRTRSAPPAPDAPRLPVGYVQAQVVRSPLPDVAPSPGAPVAAPAAPAGAPAAPAPAATPAQADAPAAAPKPSKAKPKT